MWVSEAQDAQRDKEIEAIKGKTEGSNGATEDVRGRKHDGSLCHCLAEASETRIGRRDEERRRGRRIASTKGDTGSGREPNLKLSRDIEGHTNAQTKQKALIVEKLNGRVRWVVDNGNRSKKQKKKSKDGWVKIA